MRRSWLILALLTVGAATAVLFAVRRWHPAPMAASGIDLPARLVAANPQFHTEIRPWLQQYCGDCHADGADKGGVNFDGFTNSTQVFNQRIVWERVLDNVKSGAMPPPKKKQPDAPQRQKVVAWLDHVLYPLDPQNPDPGRVTVRRLNRTEYNNTVHDLLGVEFKPADEFPQDDVGYGFDNIGDVLSLPPILFEKYLHAAQSVTEAALPSGPVRPPNRYFGPMEIQGHSHEGELYALLDKEGEVYVDFPVKQPGEFLLQVRAFGKQVPERISKERVKMAFGIGPDLLVTNEVAAKSENPRDYEFRVPLTVGKGEVAKAPSAGMGRGPGS